MDIKNKIALVTGGSKGIGRAVVEELAKMGATVVFTYATDESAANEVLQNIENPSNTIATQCEITQPHSVKALFDLIKTKYGTIDVLINNAGIFDENDSPESQEAFGNVININFLSQIRVTNHALDLMNSGKIIFMSSVHGIIGHGRPDAIAYSASKAALDSYMKNLSKHLAPQILVNSIAPGKTLTPMWGDPDDEFLSTESQDHLIGRWIAPKEIAHGVIFLLENDATCGSTLTIDGGMSLQTLG